LKRPVSGQKAYRSDRRGDDYFGVRDTGDLDQALLPVKNLGKPADTFGTEPLRQLRDVALLRDGYETRLKPRHLPGQPFEVATGGEGAYGESFAEGVDYG
jgi:hypothetical protein